MLQVNSKSIKPAFDYRFKYGAGVWGQEVIPYDGVSSGVRWLGANAQMKVWVEKNVHARFGLKLAAAGQPRRVQLIFNGVRFDQQQVTHVLWNGGFDLVAWDISLKPGDNTLIVESDLPPQTLPDGGRQVSFLLIDEAVLLNP